MNLFHFNSTMIIDQLIHLIKLEMNEAANRRELLHSEVCHELYMALSTYKDFHQVKNNPIRVEREPVNNNNIIKFPG